MSAPFICPSFSKSQANSLQQPRIEVIAETFAGVRGPEWPGPNGTAYDFTHSSLHFTSKVIPCVV